MKQELITLNGETYLIPSDEAIQSMKEYEAAYKSHVKQYDNPSKEELKIILTQAEHHKSTETYHSRINLDKKFDEETENLIASIQKVEPSGVYLLFGGARVFDTPEEETEAEEIIKQIIKNSADNQKATIL